MNERSFEIGPKKFQLSKIDAFKQFHIVRRLGPILGDIIPVAKKLQGMKAENISEEQEMEAFAELAKPFMTGLSKLSDEDANHVLIGLCSAVEMQQSHGGWAKIAVGNSLMIQDLELPELLKIAGKAFAFNLSGFFTTAQQTSHGKK